MERKGHLGKGKWEMERKGQGKRKRGMERKGHLGKGKEEGKGQW